MRHLQAKLLRRVLEIVGGRAELAARLAVGEELLERWIEDRATAPASVYHAVLDLILEDDIARAMQDRRRAPREEIRQKVPADDAGWVPGRE